MRFDRMRRRVGVGAGGGGGGEDGWGPSPMLRHLYRGEEVGHPSAALPNPGQTAAAPVSVPFLSDARIFARLRVVTSNTRGEKCL